MPCPVRDAQIPQVLAHVLDRLPHGLRRLPAVAPLQTSSQSSYRRQRSEAGTRRGKNRISFGTTPAAPLNTIIIDYKK